MFEYKPSLFVKNSSGWKQVEKVSEVHRFAIRSDCFTIHLRIIAVSDNIYQNELKPSRLNLKLLGCSIKSMHSKKYILVDWIKLILHHNDVFGVNTGFDQ